VFIALVPLNVPDLAYLDLNLFSLRKIYTYKVCQTVSIDCFSLEVWIPHARDSRQRKQLQRVYAEKGNIRCVGVGVAVASALYCLFTIFDFRVSTEIKGNWARASNPLPHSVAWTWCGSCGIDQGEFVVLRTLHLTWPGYSVTFFNLITFLMEQKILIKVCLAGSHGHALRCAVSFDR